MTELYKKIILSGFVTAISASLLIGCAGGDNNSTTTTAVTEANTAALETYTEPEPFPRFPEYILPETELVEPEGFRGDMHVVVGKNGYLFENGYINEYIGAALRYVEVTDEQLLHRVETLKNIQEALKERGVAFCVVITPSKAGSMPQFIPDFHVAEFPPLVEDYVRPYYRFLQMLIDNGVYHVDSQTVFRDVGLTNTFPKTGTHWNGLASFEVTRAIIAEYGRQRGFEVRQLMTNGVISSEAPFFGWDQDIFTILYAMSEEGRRHIDSAIVDELYFGHDAYLEPDEDKPIIGRILIRGQSFAGIFNHYFRNYGLAESTHMIQMSDSLATGWPAALEGVDFLLLEVNEQRVYNMGGQPGGWGEFDLQPLRPSRMNTIDFLWDYLRENPVGEN